jgi:hypothetical protein
MSTQSTLIVLNPQERNIGFLDPDEIHITETNELYKLRTIEITHPLSPSYDSLLKPGNKIWQNRTCDNTSVLYVIRGPKTYNYTENTINLHAIEAAVELGQYKSLSQSDELWSVDFEFIYNNFFELFQPGIITPNNHIIHCGGVVTPLGIINEIQSQIDGEFQYRYEYNTNTQKIERYIDYLPHIGTLRTEKLELGYNASEIYFEIDESNTAIGAMPLYENFEGGTFNCWIGFQALSIKRGEQIPLYYNKNENGEYIPGPMVIAPYTKKPNSNYVVCDNPTELKATYNYIQGQNRYKQKETYPRLTTFTTNQEVRINLYWECVKTIKQHLYPEIEISCNINDLKQISENSSLNYNVGDIITIQIPDRNILMPCRITKTIKKPEALESTQIEINTYHNSFLTDFYKKYNKTSDTIIP